MTEQEAIEQLTQLATNGDNEVAHVRADAVLLQFLREAGHGAVADAYEAINGEFWYA